MDWNLWVKSIHVIAVMSWMAGLLYLPRLFVYHTQAEIGSDKSETFKIMEYKLLKIIMNPAMIASWVFGFWAAYLQNQFLDSWFHLKLGFVIALTVFHMMLGKWRKDFAADKNIKSEKFYRIINEVPTALMIIIVILVIVKPI